MKRFSTVRDTQRGSQSYMKKGRGRKEIEVSRRRKRGLKRRQTDLGRTEYCSLSVLPSPDTHRDSQNWVEKRRGREEIEVTWGEKGESKGGESNQASNHTPE